MKRFFCLIAITVIVAVTVSAQIITWAVKPGLYSKIEPCWEDLYFVYNGNNVGVIYGDGREIVTPNASRITGFYGGLALVLNSDGGKERVLGILSTDGSYSRIDGIYYTIPYQEFFSEGLLTVINSKNQACYMNTNGVVVKSFNVSFISPFSEGYAVVGEGKDYSIIDKRFNTLTIQLGTVSQVYGGSNIYKGVAVVWDGNGRFYNFDVNRGICTKSKPIPIDYDYMYCFSSITGRSDIVPYTQPMRSSQTLPVSEQGNKYGYMNTKNTILPCQFEQAENFYGDYAIVKAKGGYGILSLHNTTESFDAKVSSDVNYRKSASKELSHKFEIHVPSLWKSDDLIIRVKDENGVLMKINNNNSNYYEFKSDGAIGTKKFSVEINADDLCLWNGEITYNYTVEAEPKQMDDGTRLKPLTVSLQTTNNMKADRNNRCCLKATISNPNSTPITTKVMWSGSHMLIDSNTTVTIRANDKTVVDIYLKVSKAGTTKQSVTVSTNAGGSATLNGLQPIPFD